MEGRTEPASRHFRKFGNDHAWYQPRGRARPLALSHGGDKPALRRSWGRRFPLPAFSAALAVESQPSAMPTIIGRLHPFTVSQRRLLGANSRRGIRHGFVDVD